MTDYARCNLTVVTACAVSDASETSAPPPSELRVQVTLTRSFGCVMVTVPLMTAVPSVGHCND